MALHDGWQQRKRLGRVGACKDEQGSEVLPGPKTPLWCCQCGESNNWACRIRCKGKGRNRSAPQSVINKARAAAKQQAASGNGAWAPPCRTQSGRPTKERLECEALKKEIEAIKNAIKAEAPLQQMAEG